jgi:hypothetical protein
LSVSYIAGKQVSLTNNRDAEFAYEASQIDPMKAVNPSLISDADENDYISFFMSARV